MERRKSGNRERESRQNALIDLVFDANSLYARSWFAAVRENPHPKNQLIPADLKGPLRLALNTIMLLLIADTNKIGTNVDRMLFAWDSRQNPSKHREAKPPEYHETKEVLKELLEFIFGAVNAEHEEAEGDDVVATVVRRTKKTDTVYIVSGDKDLMQLQGGNCLYYSLNDKAVLSASFIQHKFFHIHHPNQLALVLAVVGDPVDHIPGINGYGEKRFRKLYEAVTPEMTILEAANAIAAQLPPRQLQEFWEQLDRTLLRDDVPGIPDPAPITLADPNEVRALNIPQISHYFGQVWQTYMVEPY